MLSEKSLKKDFRVLRRNIDEALESFNDSTYLTITAYDCPFALVFVDEATRWKEVVPLEDKTILSRMKAFLHYRNQVMDAMAKLQSNPNVNNKTNLHIPIEDIQKMNPNKITFEVFDEFTFKLQNFRTDQETAMESSAFKEFLKQYWNFKTHDEKIQNPIDVKSFVKKNKDKCKTLWNDQNHHVEIHRFHGSTIQTVPTNQHQFNGLADTRPLLPSTLLDLRLLKLTTCLFLSYG